MLPCGTRRTPTASKIDVAFNSRVEIYTKDQLLSATRFNISAITEQLSILVLSYDSFRGKKEQLKARQENSSLAQLAQALGTPTHPVEDADPPPCCRSSTSFARW